MRPRARDPRCAPLTLALALLAGCGSCGKGSGDAGVIDDGEAPPDAPPSGPITVQHPPTGLELVAPGTWQRAEPTDVEKIARERIERLGATMVDTGARDGAIADLRRPAERGAPTLAAPRLVVVAQPSDRPVELERALDRELDAIRGLQSSGALTLQRSARTRRLLGGVDMGELRIDYAVTDPRGGGAALVVHRAWIAGRRDVAGAEWLVAIVLTYMGADEDLIAHEVEDVLKGIHFAAPGGEAETSR